MDRRKFSAATLSDVAREAGVSLATASRSLNGGSRKVNPELQARVRVVAERLNYQPNFSAQAIARGMSRVIALVVPDIADPYFCQIAAGVIAEAATHQLVVNISVTGNDPDHEVRVLRSVRGQRPMAIILTASRWSGERGAEIRQELFSYLDSGGTVSMIDADDARFGALTVKDFAGAHELGMALTGLGYRDFAVIGGPEGLNQSDGRLEGFRAGITPAGGKVGLVREEFNRAGAFRAAIELLAGAVRPELIFAANDQMALGVLGAIRAVGLEPGRDIAVAGYDGIEISNDLSPTLTTVGIDLAEIGRFLLHRALDASLEDAVISPQILLRDSTPALV